MDAIAWRDTQSATIAEVTVSNTERARGPAHEYQGIGYQHTSLCIHCRNILGMDGVSRVDGRATMLLGLFCWIRNSRMDKKVLGD